MQVCLREDFLAVRLVKLLLEHDTIDDRGVLSVAEENRRQERIPVGIDGGFIWITEI